MRYSVSLSLFLLASATTSPETWECADTGECESKTGATLIQRNNARVSLMLTEGTEGVQEGSSWKLASKCTWAAFPKGKLPSDEGEELSSAEGSAEGCQSNCDKSRGCGGFARCGGKCWLKTKRFTGDETTKQNDHCEFHYRKCPPPGSPGCYITTADGVFKLLDEAKPGWSRSDCMKAAGVIEPTFVLDPAAPKPKGGQIRFAAQNLMGWKTWCQNTNWKNIVDRIKQHKADIVAWQEMGDGCSNLNGWMGYGPNKGQRVNDAVQGRLGFKSYQHHKCMISYNPKTIRHMGHEKVCDGGFMRARFQHIESGATFFYFSVHTGCYHGHECCNNMEKLNKEAQSLRGRFPGDGMVAAGDYNTWGTDFQWGFAMNYMRGKNDCWGKPKLSTDAAWKFSNEGEGQTYCDHRNCQRHMEIDYILYDKRFEKKWSMTMQPVKDQYGDHSRYSDHTLIMSDLYIEPQ